MKQVEILDCIGLTSQKIRSFSPLYRAILLAFGTDGLEKILHLSETHEHALLTPKPGTIWSCLFEEALCDKHGRYGKPGPGPNWETTGLYDLEFGKIGFERCDTGVPSSLSSRTKRDSYYRVKVIPKDVYVDSERKKAHAARHLRVYPHRSYRDPPQEVMFPPPWLMPPSDSEVDEKAKKRRRRLEDVPVVYEYQKYFEKKHRRSLMNQGRLDRNTAGAFVAHGVISGKELAKIYSLAHSDLTSRHLISTPLACVPIPRN